MRAAGATYNEMTEACGISRTQLTRLFNPEYHARQQAAAIARQATRRATDPAFNARRVAANKRWRLRKDAKCEAYDSGRRYEDVCADWGIKP